MIGLVLAAGAGSRLHPLTEDLPKALVPVSDDRSVLDHTLANFVGAGLTDVAIVIGFAGHRIRERVPEWQERHGLRIELIQNDLALERNNVYSLWLAREAFREGALLANGDTLHPPVVEERVLAAQGDGLLLAVDRVKVLGEEEMKVLLDEHGAVRRINKAIDPPTADGEYIGISFIGPDVAADLADALEATWRRDSSLYYEDGYQELADRGAQVATVPIGAVDWVEVDNHEDLARAREIAASWRSGASG